MGDDKKDIDIVINVKGIRSWEINSLIQKIKLLDRKIVDVHESVETPTTPIR